MTKRLCFYDSETYCEVPINAGAHRYAEEVEVIVHAWAFDDGEVRVHDCTRAEKLPFEMEEAFNDPETTFIIHNSSFDRTAIRHALGINLPLDRIYDTLVQARAIGLPGGLGALCEIMRIPQDKAKDKKGKQLINLFCKPRPKNCLIRRATYATHPVEWRQFLDYARLDIEATRELYKRIPRWNYSGRERALWELDQRINDRGFCIDTDLVRAAIKAIEQATEEINARTGDATHGLVRSATKRDEFLGYILQLHGVDLPNLQADTLERRLNDENLPEQVRELIAMRLQVSMASTAKYKTLEKCISSDGYMRGTMEFCGAARTGRWAGRKFQPQNLPSRELLPAKEIDMAIPMLKNGTASILFDNMMHLTSSCLRGVVVAPFGEKLCVSDLSNIEGRMAAWLAGEEWKLEAFRAVDRGEGHDLYRLAYAKSFNISVDDVDGGKDKGPQRQIGKVLELFMQYEGGVGAFMAGVVTYGIDLDGLADAAFHQLPGWAKGEAAGAWDWANQGDRTFGLKRETYMTCDALKRMWREAHPAISSYWKELRITTVQAIGNKNRWFKCRKVHIGRFGNWLQIMLPSGRLLCYAAPRVEDDNIFYKGIHQYSRNWSSIVTYGGKLLENITQASSRDVMAHNMPGVDACGYKIVLTVHDELITQAPDNDDYSADELSAMLATNPYWAPGLPLAAGGFESYRYRKD